MKISIVDLNKMWIQIISKDLTMKKKIEPSKELRHCYYIQNTNWCSQTNIMFHHQQMALSFLTIHTLTI